MNSQAWNRFSYVNNNPINFNDPSGHATCTDDGYCGKISDRSYQKHIYSNAIKDVYKWKLKGKWSLDEMKTIYETGRDIEKYADNVTGGSGLDWMHSTFRNTTIVHGENNGEHSETWPTLFGPKIWLGKGWLDDGGWDSKELFAHELAHVWDINSGFAASGKLNKSLGGSSWCYFCSPGSDVPQWNPRVHPYNGDAYGNSGRNEYFAEAFSQTIYDGNTPNGVSSWIDFRITFDLIEYLVPGARL